MFVIILNCLCNLFHRFGLFMFKTSKLWYSFYFLRLIAFKNNNLQVTRNQKFHCAKVVFHRVNFDTKISYIVASKNKSMILK